MNKKDKEESRWSQHHTCCVPKLGSRQMDTVCGMSMPADLVRGFAPHPSPRTDGKVGLHSVESLC